MSSYTKINLEQVPDLAPEFGMDQVGEARFARQALGAEQVGMAFYRTRPNCRLGFGHAHETTEEMYLVLGGGGRFRIGEDTIDVAERDVVYVPAETMREFEAGPDGLEMVAFGAHREGENTDMNPEFWKD